MSDLIEYLILTSLLYSDIVLSAAGHAELEMLPFVIG